MVKTLKKYSALTMVSGRTLSRFCLLVLVLPMLSACNTVVGAFKAYEGPEMPAEELATLQGARFVRTDFINRLTDTIRFMSVDGRPIENAEMYSAIQVAPGFHDITVYFSWDMGSQRGLAPALVTYAATRDTINRTLRLHAEAGKTYIVKGDPVFRGQLQDITSLDYVNFWIEDEAGNTVVSREEGAYVASP